MKKYKNNIIAIVLAAILSIFIWHQFLVSGNTVIFILITMALYYFIKRTIDNENKRKFIISAIIAFIFAGVEIVCTSINIDYTVDNIINKWLIINFSGYWLLAWSIISNLYTFFDKQEFSNKTLKIGKIEILADNKVSYAINMALIFIAYLPYFLRYYPGLLTADSCTQVAQAIGLKQLTNHHPILHTAIISTFINLGINAFNNINTGVALYTLFQMIAMSAIFAYVLKYMSKKNIPIIVRIITLLYYMFYPINAIFSVAMWKDVLFAGIMPIFIIESAQLIFNTELFFSKKSSIIKYIAVAILAFFLRNNGMYVIILTMPFVAIALRKYWKKVIPMFLTIIILHLAIKTVIFNIFNIQKGSIAEMLSIPLQQIARVEKHHIDELDDETIKQIDKFFKVENIGEKYNPVLSDPVKNELNVQQFEKNKLEFIKLWLKLMRMYFKEYVESFISNSYGYYYPEAKHWVINRTMEKNNMGIEQTPIIEGKLVSEIDSNIEERDTPILSMCFSIGMAFWVIIACLGYKILKKEYKSILLYLPILVLWLTIVASPVFCEYRYAYSMFTSLPLYISFNFIRRKEIKYGKDSSIDTML